MKATLVLLFCLSFLVFNCDNQHEPIKPEYSSENETISDININAFLNVKINASSDNVEIKAGKSAFIKGGSYMVTASAYSGGILFNNDLDGVLFTIPSDNILSLTGDFAVSNTFQAGVYKSSDGTAGMSDTKIFNDNLGYTHTIIIKNGLITNWNVNTY